jgi:RimJ/RimL family protein N-acetyltransferase
MAGEPPAAAIPATGQQAPPQAGPAPVASSPLDALSWPVRTARLQLRPAVADDAEAAWEFWQLEAVTRWVTRAPATFEDHRAVFASPARLATTLGDLMINVEDAWAQAEVAEQAQGVQAELGWFLHPDHAGRGYATEAVRELIRICFTDLALRRVTANCFADNEASWRLMERVGMRREVYTVRDSLHRSGRWLDGMGYALLADEWQP